MHCGFRDRRLVRIRRPRPCRRPGSQVESRQGLVKGRSRRLGVVDFWSSRLHLRAPGRRRERGRNVDRQRRRRRRVRIPGGYDFRRRRALPSSAVRLARLGRIRRRLAHLRRCCRRAFRGWLLCGNIEHLHDSLQQGLDRIPQVGPRATATFFGLFHGYQFIHKLAKVGKLALQAFALPAVFLLLIQDLLEPPVQPLGLPR